MPTESQVVDWLNENEQRAYPLMEYFSRKSTAGYTLPDDVILDAQLRYTSLPASVKLTSVVSDSTNITFTITDQPTTFVVPKVGPFPYFLKYPKGLLVVGQSAANIPVGTHTFNSATFEPSVCFEFGAEWLGVSSVTFGTNTMLAGVISLLEGIQSQISITNNVLSLGAGGSFGIPLGCTDLGSFPLDCDSIISFINGVSGDTNHTVAFRRGNDIIILDDPDNHRIFIGLSFLETDICKTILPNPEI